ncbi:KxYKxGKxW signal peptide domain-containing protein [Schleiferilactobacillus harbinensis]|uniref:KxYKxGKxW signal peptide domain-containing protein n=1 Tax=Schleiferilactobacillus harbinensis TaxID=304207 RepID=A0ABU7SXR0_9LACO
MFKMGNQNRYDQDIKLHYRMYKAGKRWIVAGVAVMSFSLVLAGKPQFVQAAVAEPQTTSEVAAKAKADQQSGIAANAATKTAAPVSQATTQTEANVPAAETKAQDAAKTADNTTAVKSAIKTNTSVLSNTTAQASVQAQLQTTDQTDQAQAAGTKAAAKPADSAATPQQLAATEDDTKADTQNDAKDAKTDTKTDTKADSKETADDDYQTTKDKTDHANALAAKANQSAAALQALLKDPKPDDTAWLTQVNAALNDLAKTSSDFTGTKINTDEVVAAYQAALKNLLNQPQPSAIQKVQVGSKDEAATLANYSKLVDAYTSQVNTILAKVKNGQANYATAEALQAAQKQLQAAADQLNAAIKQAVDSANNGDTAATEHAVTAPDTTGQTLDDYKHAYDDALTAYNSNVAVYNDTTTDPTQKIDPVGTNPDTSTTPDPTKNPAQTDYDQFKDEVTKAAAQNNAHNHYAAANAAYNKTQTALTGLANTVGAWQTAADNYNKMVAGVNDGTQVTTADLTAGQAAVTKAQTDLTTAVNQFASVNDTYNQALADYQTALNDYTAKTGKNAQTAALGYGSSDANSTWNQFQSTITKLQNDFTGTDTTAVPAQNEAIMQQNLVKFQAIQDIGAAARNLQVKVEQINAAAKAQQNAVDTWNSDIAAAKADGRWAFFFEQLHLAGDDLTAKDYQYIDAVNGTTTPITSTTGKADYGKTYTDIQVGQAMVNTDTDIAKDATKASYASAVTAYLKAVNAYNATVTKAEDKLSTGDPTDAATAIKDANNLKNGLEGTNGFSVQYQKLIKTLAGLAADPDQNAQALKTLADPQKLSMDGSTSPQKKYNSKVQTLMEAVVFSSGTWNDALQQNFNNATFINDQTFNPTQYTVIDDKAAHQLSAASLKRIFEGQWNDLDYNPIGFTLQPTYTQDGKKHYLAGYGIFQGTNSDGDLNGTNQIYTFTSADAEQEFEKNGLKLSGDSSQNSYVIFYYLSETDYSQMIPTPTPAKATNVNPVKTPSLTMTSVSAYGPSTALPAPTTTDTVTANGPAYLAGTPVTPDYQSPDTTIQGAPTITLNQPKAPSTPGTPGGPGPGTPDDPSVPTTPSDPGTPGEPSTPDQPGTPTTPGQPGIPVTPSQPSKPGTPITSGQTSQHGSQGGQWSNLTSNARQAGQVRGSRRTLRQVVSLPGHQLARTRLPQTGEHRSTGLMALGAALMAMSLVFGWTLTDRKRRQD